MSIAENNLETTELRNCGRYAIKCSTSIAKPTH